MRKYPGNMGDPWWRTPQLGFLKDCIVCGSHWRNRTCRDFLRSRQHWYFSFSFPVPTLIVNWPANPHIICCYSSFSAPLQIRSHFSSTRNSSFEITLCFIINQLQWATSWENMKTELRASRKLCHLHTWWFDPTAAGEWISWRQKSVRVTTI